MTSLLHAETTGRRRYALITQLIVIAASLALVSTAGVTSVRAQRSDPLARAMTAYRELEYDEAATRFREVLNSATIVLTPAERSRARMFLGATELFRGARDSSIATFRDLLIADPRYRPDELVFPPEVSALFQETRLGVRAVAVAVPAATEVQGAADRLPIRLYASALHEIRAQIVGPQGRVEGILHIGVVGDSLEVLWNPRDALGHLREPGRYLLRVASRGPDGRTEREVEVPLDLRRIQQDSLPHPEPLAPSAFRPETVVRSSGVRPLLTGLVTAVVIAVLPSVVGSEEPGMGVRVGVAGAVGAAGVVGLTRATTPRPLPENIEYNRRQREQWQREVDRVIAENSTRRAAARLQIRAGVAAPVKTR
ncbi:MAG: hypothetical protein ACKVS7_05815 [Gemmatimonadaceae bacterium]